MPGQAVSDVRPSPIAGQWYPGQPHRLTSMLDDMLAAAVPPDITGQIVSLVVPHAGLIYSGPVAAHAFKLVQGRSYQRVVVASPMHQLYPGRVLTTAHHAYETPLGAIPVDMDFVRALNDRLPLTAVRNDPEHAVEIELPFLQHVLAAPFKLVPLMLRDQTFEAARRLGETLADLLDGDDSTLLVASSDLSHFYTDEQARRLDSDMLEQVANFDPQGVIRIEDEGRAFACGRAAIATMLVAARGLGADQVEIVGYGTSADTTGDTQRVVGYGAAVAYRSA